MLDFLYGKAEPGAKTFVQVVYFGINSLEQV